MYQSRRGRQRSGRQQPRPRHSVGMLHRVPSASFMWVIRVKSMLVEPDEESVKDALATDLALGRGVVPLRIGGWVGTQRW